MWTHAVCRAIALARDFLRQQVMIPADAVAFNKVPGAIEHVGLGRIITDADR
jgi:transketolase C-terminal domain/subunit